MKYEDLLNGHFRYGTTKEDIIKRKGYENILENVVIAPWWSHEIFLKFDVKVEQVSKKVFNIYGDGFEFSYIELKSIGATVILDDVLSLGVTNAKNLIFLGSVGSLDENIKIGDIVIPNISICGDGASRYLNKNLEDNFGEKVYPNKDMFDKICNIVDKMDIKYHNVTNFSIDTVFAQFSHIEKIKELGCKSIEMETASLFKVCELCNIKCVALLCVSDNTVVNKSLYSGRSEEENIYRHKVRDEIIPKIVIEMFKR